MRTLLKISIAASFCMIASPALASFPRAIASGNYVNAEVRVGNQNQSPEQMQVRCSGNVTNGTPCDGYEGQKICARRESYPGSANSGMTAWSCASSYNGIQVGSPTTVTY